MAVSSAITSGTRVTGAVLAAGFPKGVIAQGNRPTSKSDAGGGVEVGVLRLDGVDLVGGRAYRIETSNLRHSSTTATDHVKATIRWTDTGVAATTSAAEIGRSEGTTSTDSMGPAIAYLNPASDVDGSFLLTIDRTTGTGTVTLQADTGGIWLTVIDLGVAVADTGVDI